MLSETPKYERQPTRFEQLSIHFPPRPESLIPIIEPDLSTFKSPDAYTLPSLKKELQEYAVSLSQSASDITTQLIEAPESIEADLTIPCFPLAKTRRKSPQLIAQEEADNLNKSVLPPMIAEAKAEGPYLNFLIDTDAFGESVLTEVELLGKHYGEQNIGNGAKVILDTSSPNIAKYMSVGHLRSTVIGESLGRINQAAGYTVIRDNHLGDWGTQFGMLGAAFERWGGNIPMSEMSVKSLYQLYVKIHDEVALEKADDQAKESVLERAGREWFQRLENGDPEAKALWQSAYDLSMKEFNRVYELLGSHFEYALGESQYVPIMPSVVETFEKTGIAVREANNAISIPRATLGFTDVEETTKEDLANNSSDGKNTKRVKRGLIIQKGDGTSVYATRDLAALIAREVWFKPAKMLYVVGGGQEYYFKQVFGAFRALAGEEGSQLEHVPFGLINLPEGKMSTRAGRVIFLEDVLREAMTRAEERIKPEKAAEMSEEEKRIIARQVGVGAVIFFDLGHNRERNIMFDMNKALSLEGYSAPYIQYAYTRANSIINKSKEQGITIDPQYSFHAETAEEANIVKQIAKYPEIIQKALEMNQPSVIAEYSYQVANLFNSFYKKTSVLSAETEELKQSRLRLTAAAAQVIKNSLYLLGIEAPEKM